MKAKKTQADRSDFEKREANIKSRSKFFSHLSVSLLTLLLTLGLFQADFDGLKGVLVDGLFRAKLSSRPHDSIRLVAYNSESTARHSISEKIPAEELAKTVSLIGQDLPLVIAILAPINERLYTEYELTQLAEVFSKTIVFVGYTDGESLGKNAPRSLYHTARYLPGFVSRDTFSFGADSVSRRVMLTVDGLPTIFSKLSELYRNSLNLQDESYPINLTEKFGGSIQTHINWQGPKGTYPISSFSQVTQSKLEPGFFRNKIVILGSALSSNKDRDFIFTPFSRSPFDTTMLEGAAHSLATLLNQNGIVKSSYWASVILSFLVGLIAMNLIVYLSPARSIQFLIGLTASLGFISWTCLNYFNYWLDIAHPLVLLGVGYYLIIPYRLVSEYKKRWHYQEKSEFMAELEQLKSNFLSLISHDLKTPLARIQGNAEIALATSTTTLNDKQKKSLQSIVHTTEELSSYVETILDLTRIESSKIHLHKTSKDINSVITDVVRSKAPLAQEKNIRIETQLEPLFSFKFDVKLIQQVIANLLENAIKYSPENSTVVLESKEIDSQIEVCIKDQGYGIPAEEQDKIFSKFYRINNSQTEKEKGTGLGLYLVKYFVELHEGFVTLNSQLGKGSNFTIRLPV